MDELADKFQEIVEVFRARWDRTAGPDISEADKASEIAELIMVTHQVAGSAGTYGFAGISPAARSIELLLKSLSDATEDRLAERMAQIGIQIRNLELIWDDLRDRSVNVSLDGVNVDTPAHNRRVLIVDGNLGRATEIADQILQFDYEVRKIPKLDDAMSVVAEYEPTATIVEWTDAIEGSTEVEIITQLSTKTGPIGLAERADFATRLTAARANCAAFLTWPVQPADLIDRLDRICGSADAEPYQILIVEDDLILAEGYAMVLRGAGMTVEILGAPQTILESMAENLPDLVLLDLHMPEVSGIELARVVRQQPQFNSLPLVFLSGERDVTQQQMTKTFGGDDFVEKPVRPDHLVMAVTSRAERGRLLRAAMERDSLTGLLNHVSFKERAESEAKRAARTGSSFSLAMVDLDFFKSVNDNYGHLAGDMVLKSLTRGLVARLRQSDVVGRYGGEEFAVLLLDTDEGNATHVMDLFRAAFADVTHQFGEQSFKVTLSCGVCGFGADLSSEDMIARADAAFYRAKGAGRNRVFAASKLEISD
jgi:diguanylate cyclase (GGDEF)-like protein